MSSVLSAFEIRSGPLEVGREEAVWASEQLKAWTSAQGLRPDALVLASSDAGAGASVRFWAEATERGLRFANPRLFPWTLANSPAGQVGLTLDIRGPTYTLVGGEDAALAAIVQALDDIEDGLARMAVVVGLDGERDGNSVHLAALALTGSHGGGRSDPLGTIERIESDEPSPGVTVGSGAERIAGMRSGDPPALTRPVDLMAALVRSLARRTTLVVRGERGDPTIHCSGLDAGFGG